MELFDLYTAERQPLHRTVPRGERLPEGCYHLVIHVCIFNSRGEMLIQHRQPFKSGWSNMWDVSCGGSAVSGDSSRSAAEREVFEELGIKLDLNGVRPVLTVHREEVINDIYVIKKDVALGELRLQPEEVQAAKWASEDEILSMIAHGEFIPYSEHYIRLLFFLRDHTGMVTREDFTACAEKSE